MKKTFLPLALLALLPLASCASLTNEQSKTKAGLNEGDVSEETSTTSEENAVTENEYVALFNKLSADDYLSINNETLEGDYTYKTTISWEDLSLTLSYKEVIKEDESSEEVTPNEGTGEESTLPNEGKHPYFKHGHDFEKEDHKTRYEGELVFGENTYTVKGKSELEEGFSEFEFKFALDESTFGELEFATSEGYKEFYYEEGTREALSKAYAYSLYTHEDFSYVYALALDGESFNEVLLSKFVYEEVTYLSVDTYLNETETHLLGKLTVTEDGTTTFEEVTLPDFDPEDDKEDEDDKGCDCDCDCCQNHHHGNKDDFDFDDEHEDFDFDDFDYDDEHEDFDYDFDFEDDDFEDFGFEGHGEGSFSHGEGRPDHR